MRRCHCQRTWPEMRLLNVGGGGVKYYACPECGAVRREERIGNVPGTAGAVTLYDADDPDLPEAVRELVRKVRHKGRT